MSASRRSCLPSPTSVLLTAAVLVPLVLAGSFVTASDDPGLQEPSTDLVFPLERPHPRAEAPLTLTGVGVRKKLFFKVYAMGLYVDAERIREALAPWKGQSAERLVEDEGIYRALLDADADRLVVMRFVRDVGAESMRDALADALERGSVPANDPAREAFLALWTETLADGEEVTLLFGADGRIVVRRDGRAVGEVDSPRVSRSVLASWLGTDPVSDDIREGVLARMPRLLD
jgi:hypothetical protein